MPRLAAALKAALALLLALVVADMAGAFVCTVLDIAAPRGWSAALPYVIWLVFGVFCGLCAYNMAGAWATSRISGISWIEHPGAKRLGTTILVTDAILLAVAAGACSQFVWRADLSADDYYVPDSMPHSIVFVLAVLGGLALARFAFMPARKPGQDFD